MRVVVEILPVARDQMLRLLEERSPSTTDAIVAGIAYCEEVIRIFEEYAAPPPGAILRPRGKKASWWLFADGIWLAFTREDLYVGLRPFFRKVERKFTVVAAAAEPSAP